MEHRHQPEPWKLTYDDGGLEGPALRDKDGMIVADVWGKANGLRIVACVNACEGISDEALDSWMNPPDGGFGHPHGPWPAHIISLQRAAEANAKQRDKMLTILQRAEGFIAGFEGDETQEGIDDLLAEIRAATFEASS